MTIRERRGALAGQKLCFVGDGSNMPEGAVVMGGPGGGPGGPGGQ